MCPLQVHVYRFHTHCVSVRKVFLQYIEQVKARAQTATKSMLGGIRDMPDFYVEIGWDFHSWVRLQL